MKTVLLATETPEALALAVSEAVRLLKEGQPVAIPTETVYGLAADALNPEAALKIFEAKERPFFDPLIVHIPSSDWVGKLARVGPEDEALVRELTERFWPGPLTLVLPRSEAVPDLVASGLSTVAIRMSGHPVFQAVTQALGRPLAAPSANRFGRISPTAASHVMSELSGRIPLVLDGGEAAHGVESTIIAVSKGRIEVLRNGPVTLEELRAFGEVTRPGAISKPVAPGQLKSHYAPRTPMRLLPPGVKPEPLPGVKCGLLALSDAADGEGFERVERLSANGDLREAATRLFAAMRRLDESGVSVIIAESVQEEGLGLAIMDRLRKASYHEE